MTNIVVPELGESVVEARVARWLKKEGDRVEVGDPLVELETEKVDLEVNADKGGVLASIKRREGEDVKIGELLGVVDETVAAAPGAQASHSSPVAHSAKAEAGNGSSGKGSGNGSTGTAAKPPAPAESAPVKSAKKASAKKAKKKPGK